MQFTMNQPAMSMKLPDNVVATGIMGDAKLKALSYCLGTLESSNPQVREVMQRHLNDTLLEHQRWGALAIHQGWYDAFAEPQALVQQAASQAMPAMQQY